VTPYASFLYFGLLLYPIAPALVLGWLGRLSWRYVLLASAAMLLVQYGARLDPWATGGLGLLALYTAYEFALAQAFFRLRRRGKVRWAYHAAVALALLPLAAVKFWPLLHAAHAAGALAGAGGGGALSGGGAHAGGGALLPRGLFDQVGFLGISYMTFRVLDVVIGVQDGVIRELGSADLLAYLLFFPTVSAGPIDRFRRFVGDLRARRTRAEFLADADAGVRRVVQGFLYKFVLAALIDRYWLAPAAAGRDAAHLASYMYAYSLYLFFDFAGYSAFAIGVGRFFGVRTPENFAGPFLARSFRDVWNRWHMTLSFWFRDHVYMRFVLGATRGRRFRDPRTASYVGFLLTMGLMGLWHGPRLNYLVYGVYQGAMLVLYDALARWNKRRALVPDTPLTRALSVAATFNLFCFGLLIFSGHWFR
jgi:membrane protein involved in D-alanine export